jgi:hypothetical protein
MVLILGSNCRDRYSFRDAVVKRVYVNTKYIEIYQYKTYRVAL